LKGNIVRILYVNDMNQVAKTYQSELTRRGHSVNIYEPRFDGGLAPLPIKIALMPRRILNFRHVIVNLNPDFFDIVHIHWASYGVLGLMSSIPFIVHCRGDDVRDRLNQPLFRPILTTILRRAAAVMCITPDLLHVVQSVRSDVIFSPAPVDTERFTPGGSSPSTPWTVLLFARLDPDKGVDTTIQGIARFARRHPNVRVQLLDWGDLKGKYKREYAGFFEFIPTVTPDKVEHLIRSANVIVGQLTLGALGLSELQAMSCAKPVIASFRYGEAYPTPPPLCQASIAEEVVEHLEYLFQHPEVVTTLGQKGREWVIRYHDYRTLSDELEKIYRSIIERTGVSNLFQYELSSYQPSVAYNPEEAQH
jgi:glycosyltransferase involved in cell wall biosynthesis